MFVAAVFPLFIEYSDCFMTVHHGRSITKLYFLESAKIMCWRNISFSVPSSSRGKGSLTFWTSAKCGLLSLARPCFCCSCVRTVLLLRGSLAPHPDGIGINSASEFFWGWWPFMHFSCSDCISQHRLMWWLISEMEVFYGKPPRRRRNKQPQQ